MVKTNNIKQKQNEAKQEEVKSIKFRKLTNAPFGFKGRIIKEKVFELTKEEAEDKRIKTAIKVKLIEVVEG